MDVVLGILILLLFSVLDLEMVIVPRFRLVASQLGECGVHLVGQRLVSVLVDAQLV